MMQSDYYRNASDSLKADLLKACYDYAFSSAKYAVLGDTGDSAYRKTLRMMDSGLSFSQWTQFRNSVDADGNGSVSKGEVTAYIEAHYPQSQWSRLFDAYNGGNNWKNPY